MAKYWELEKPETIQTLRNLFKRYKQAGKFQLALLYKDDTGELKQGKTVSLDSEDLACNPAALDLLQSFIDDCREQVIS